MTMNKEQKIPQNTQKKKKNTHRRKRSMGITLFLLLLLLLPGILDYVSAASGEESLSEKAASDLQGVWVATVVNLDYPKSPASDERQLQAQLDDIVAKTRQTGLNAIFFQVRPTADAFYPSEIYPWSKYLTGKQGTAPGGGFDPLAYLLEAAHKEGIQVHAWINPYRITKEGEADYEGLTAHHPAKLHPDWVICHTDGNYYFDPGLPEVRKLVIDGVLEIMEGYDIDGIHMDDYFYPDASFPDEATFALYGANFSDIGDWRRNNVNLLVEQLSEAIRRENPEMIFGISPTGIWANSSSLSGGSDTKGQESYFHVYADTRKWVKEEWVDYIAPQIYWNIGYEIADYQVLLDWWTQTVKGTDVELYIGMAAYKAGSEDPASPWFGTAEIEKQLRLNDQKTGVSGEILFRYGSLEEISGLEQTITNYYKGEHGENSLFGDHALSQEIAAAGLKSFRLLCFAAWLLP